MWRHEKKSCSRGKEGEEKEKTLSGVTAKWDEGGRERNVWSVMSCEGRERMRSILQSLEWEMKRVKEEMQGCISLDCLLFMPVSLSLSLSSQVNLVSFVVLPWIFCVWLDESRGNRNQKERKEQRNQKGMRWRNRGDRKKAKSSSERDILGQKEQPVFLSFHP